MDDQYRHKEVSVGFTFEDRPLYRRRSWFERLFSFPWRPLQREEFIGSFSDMVTETIRRNEKYMLEALRSPLLESLRKTPPT